MDLFELCIKNGNFDMNEIDNFFGMDSTYDRDSGTYFCHKLKKYLYIENIRIREKLLNKCYIESKLFLFLSF